MGLPDETRSVPLNPLGGYRFPDAVPLDPDLVATIKRTESRLIGHRPPQPFQTSRWEPSHPRHWAEMPGIPDFLRLTAEQRRAGWEQLLLRRPGSPKHATPDAEREDEAA
jgi:hypothetical protein